VLAGGVVVTALPVRMRQLALAAPVVLVLATLTAVQAARWRDGHTLWTYAVATNPTSGFAWYRLADEAWRAGDVDTALARYRRAAELAPGFPELENDFAAALAAKGDFAGASTHYHTALALNPRFALAHTSLGVALEKQGKLSEAIEEHRQALAIDPRMMEAHANLASALEEQGDSQQAMKEYERALAIRPSAEVYSNVGRLLANIGHLEQAVDAFRRAVEVRPDLAVVRENLAQALLATGDRDGAAAQLEEVLRREPGRAEARRLLAEIQDGQR